MKGWCHELAEASGRETETLRPSVPVADGPDVTTRPGARNGGIPPPLMIGETFDVASRDMEEAGIGIPRGWRAATG